MELKPGRECFVTKVDDCKAAGELGIRQAMDSARDDSSQRKTGSVVSKFTRLLS